MAAGKISGPGGIPPEVPAAGDAEGARPPGPVEGEQFADKLGGARGPGAAAPAAPAGGITSDLAAELGAGKITAQAAIERVIQRVVDRQVGPDAPASVREKVRVALETALADDPVLSEKIKALGA